MPKKPFFYFDELKLSDKIAIGIYLVLTLVLLYSYNFLSPQTTQFILIMYIVVPQLSIYIFLYVSLRNFKVYLIWMFFSFVNILMYFIFRKNPDLVMYRGNPSSGLINTIVLLLLFQLLRYFSLQIQHREFVAPAKGGGKDLIENRELTLADYSILIIYMGSWFGLFYFSLNFIS
jgi:hypothetical protein